MPCSAAPHRFHLMPAAFRMSTDAFSSWAPLLESMLIYYASIILSTNQLHIDLQTLVHPKLPNISSRNVTTLSDTRNPRERMFVVQISLFIVTFLFLTITKFVYDAKPSKQSTHTLALFHVSICGVPPSYSYYFSSSTTCSMLVHASTTSSRMAKWSGPHHTTPHH